MPKIAYRIVIICITMSTVFSISPLLTHHDDMANNLSYDVPFLRMEDEYNGTTPSEISTHYTWISWSEGLDIDKDGFNDTVTINYNMTDFNVEGIVTIYFKFEITSESETIYDLKSFYGSVSSPEDILTFSWSWSVKNDTPQDYSIVVTQKLEGQIYGNEEFVFQNLVKMDLIDSFLLETSLVDQDQDGKNDTTNIELLINFPTKLSTLDLDVITEVKIWDVQSNDWKHVTDKHDTYTVRNTNKCVIQIVYSALYDGNYNLTLFLSNQYLKNFETFDVEVSLSRFILLSYHQGSLKLFDFDRDGLNDSFRLNYDLIFTITAEVEFWIEIKVTRGHSTIFTQNVYFHDYVIRGVMQNFDYLWHSTVAGGLKVEVVFSYEYTPIVNDIYDISLYSYDIVLNTRTFVENLDTDGNGKVDTAKIHNEIKFKAAGMYNLGLTVLVYKQANDGSWSYSTRFYSYFTGNVTTEHYYDVWLLFHTSDLVNYRFVVDVHGLNDKVFYIKGRELFFNPQEKYQVINDWNYDIEYFDLDSDGMDDTVDVTVNFQVLYSGIFDFSLNGGLFKGFTSFTNTQRLEKKVLSPSVWYSITLRLSAYEEGAYIIRVGLREGNFVCKKFEISWENAKAFHFLSEYKCTFTELDLDDDGLNDTLFLELDFKPSYSGQLTMILVATVYFRNTETSDWKLLSSPNFPLYP
ncbi:MAG: hypothetical protein ACTSW1_00565, partial [Candidatus Hodarchaeales archaeon]